MDRLFSIDVLRGFALLGILVPNMFAFAWPTAGMTDPTIVADTPLNHLAHDINATVFLGKFMFIFSLLFGSGVIMYSRKFDTQDEHGNYHTKLHTGAPLWYTRCGILLFFGLIHAYLFWFGDILTYYAVAGLTLLWWVRRLNPKIQFFGGLALYYFGAMLLVAMTVFGYWAYTAGHITANELSADPKIEIEGYLGSFMDAFRTRFFFTLIFQLTFGILLLPALWGIMSMGMGLTRLNILSGQRSMRFYIFTAAICLSIGLLTTFGAFAIVNTQFDALPGFMWQGMAQPLGVPLAFGYAALVIALSKTNAVRLITVPLSAVGRMALTNYFLHTLLCTTLFYGYGFGYFSKLQYPTLWYIIAAIWMFNIIFSLLWLRFFLMGPMEWVWRAATYRQLVPILKQSPP
jgi:uncharacterized protein